MFFLHSIARSRLVISGKALRVAAVLAIGFLFIFTISKLEEPGAFSSFEFWLGVVSIPINLSFYLWQKRKYRLQPKTEQDDLSPTVSSNSMFRSKQLRKLAELSWLAKIMRITSIQHSDSDGRQVFENSIQKVFYYSLRRIAFFGLSLLISSFALETYFVLTQSSTFAISALDFEVFTMELRAVSWMFVFVGAAFVAVDIQTLQRIGRPKGQRTSKLVILFLVFLMFGLNVLIFITRTDQSTFLLDGANALFMLWSNLVIVFSGLLMRRSNNLMLESLEP